MAGYLFPLLPLLPPNKIGRFLDDHYHYGSYTTFLPQEARPYADALPHYWQALTLLAGAAVVPLLAVAGTARRPAEASTRVARVPSHLPI